MSFQRSPPNFKAIEESSSRRDQKRNKDGTGVNIVDSLSSLLEGKPSGFLHFVIHAPSSQKYFIKDQDYFLDHQGSGLGEEGFVIVADWKQFYKEQNEKQKIPRIKDAYFSICSAEDYIKNPLAAENQLLTVLQDEWNLMYGGQTFALPPTPFVSADASISDEKIELSVMINVTDVEASSLSRLHSPLNLRETSSSISPPHSPLFSPSSPPLSLPLTLHLRLASSCLQIGGLNSCAAIIGKDIDIKELILRSKACVNEEMDCAYKLLSYPLYPLSRDLDYDRMDLDREENDMRNWPPDISYKLKKFFEYFVLASGTNNVDDLCLFVCLQKYSDGYVMDLPGGRRNLGESIEDALRRETIEESGVILSRFSSESNEDTSCQSKIDEFVDADMCFYVIYQDVYKMGSSIALECLPLSPPDCLPVPSSI